MGNAHFHICGHPNSNVGNRKRVKMEERLESREILYEMNFSKPRYYREPVPQCKKADLMHAITFNRAWVLQGLLHRC